MNQPEAQPETRSIKSAVLWALRRTRGIDKRLLLLVLTTGLVRSLIPLGLALAGRELINAVAAGSLERAWPWLVLSMLLTMVMALMVSVFNFCSQLLKDKLDLEIVSDVLRRVSLLEFALLENRQFQDVLHQVRQSAGLHFSIFINNTIRVASNALIALGFVVIITAIAPVFFLVALPVAVAYLLFNLVLARRGYQEEKANVSKWRWSHYYVRMLTEASSASEIRLLSLGRLCIDRFRELVLDIIGRRKAVLRLQLIGELGFTAILVAVVYYFLWDVVQYALKGRLTIGDLVIFAGAVTQVRTLMQASMSGVGEMRKSLFHISALMSLYDYDLKQEPDGGQVPERRTGRIEVQGVSFTYPGGERPALCDISLSVEPGETLALVGENGTGKSTLVKLLGRLYSPDQGRILVDGLDLRLWRRDALHQRFSFALQYFGRYEASAAENIAFGNWLELGGNPERIERVARETGIHDMLTSLPNGYDTKLGWLFGEYSLSGGQWQQIALARAFCRQDAILVLDEPTAHLDAMTEYHIFQRFSEMARNQTTILISHRFTTVSMADRIAVMEQGRIVELGGHRELLALGGRYARMYNLQASRFMQDPQPGTPA
ncbi:ABC transporter ATP-binding protein [Desulfoferula mesophila]|uniref:HlyB/MsbA family ABC transporter n=1 Tax=Desulfoferula mesophila TaxID=3058419 RepID=A0AAU9EJQ1_9BACT|nr:HlyB/MsbA family ABC transporter [Desulfoferula mesophilus]